MAKRETIEARKQRAQRIVQQLRELYGDADCALEHTSAFQLLISTILSAQSTDDTVNKVTPALFQRYPTAEALAVAEPTEVEALIHATGFFRQKSKSIIGAARKIVADFDGQVPNEMDKLLTLPGVARKTANVVLGTWFGKNIGVVVDTHVGRLAERLALCWNQKNSKDAPRIEQDLMRIVPQPDWTFLSHALIWHGRKVCAARKPQCQTCALAGNCPANAYGDGVT